MEFKTRECVLLNQLPLVAAMKHWFQPRPRLKGSASKLGIYSTIPWCQLNYYKFLVMYEYDWKSWLSFFKYLFKQGVLHKAHPDLQTRYLHMQASFIIQSLLPKVLIKRQSPCTLPLMPGRLATVAYTATVLCWQWSCPTGGVRQPCRWWKLPGKATESPQHWSHPAEPHFHGIPS